MDEGRVRKIILIDMDAFYSSFEQRDNPDLKSRPVAASYPAKHGVVAAASYEPRGFGIRSAAFNGRDVSWWSSHRAFDVYFAECGDDATVGLGLTEPRGRLSSFWSKVEPPG